MLQLDTSYQVEDLAKDDSLKMSETFHVIAILFKKDIGYLEFDHASDWAQGYS